MRIRDPIHGTIPVSDEERAVIDSRFFQRLRHVRQLGFGELAYPGATHTRHAHSLGAMHVAGRLFQAVAHHSKLPDDVRQHFCLAVRLAVLCHDLGHMPLSHASESIAPQKALLGLPRWLGTDAGQATHEDFTARIVLDSSLTSLIERHFGPLGLTPLSVASLITGQSPPGGMDFSHAGKDWTPLLRALVSGELDADRMDYLLRDSFYTGVNYGRYDLDWIVHNLWPVEKDGRVYLGLNRAAAFAFEDFLLSRYHMFIAVYYHHTPVSFDHMLRRFYRESPGEFEIPADPEAFLHCDDVALATALRGSANPWAQRIVTRQGYKLIVQFTERDEGYDLGALSEALSAAGVEHFAVESRGVLSKYTEEGGVPGLYIVDHKTGRSTEVSRYTPLYERFGGPVTLRRLYVRPDQGEQGREVVARVTRRPVLEPTDPLGGREDLPRE
ncbi:MAG: HD domain-containing protein [Myxococcaceae bacterium]|nr:HD domain-containing protein [Myxococcaceae bacterium]MCI0670773.1 HD domain-containing protein [Myxococcaceae bacterium]